MELVKKGRTWEINSKEDYVNAMRKLDENEFVAEMSDDFTYWKSEKEEVRLQRAVVRRQAIEKGIIKPDERWNESWHDLC